MAEQSFFHLPYVYIDRKITRRIQMDTTGPVGGQNVNFYYRYPFFRQLGRIPRRAPWSRSQERAGAQP
jgi:hypothetical protein